MWIASPVRILWIDFWPQSGLFVTSEQSVVRQQRGKRNAAQSRTGLPEEVADVILYLASPESHWIKGQDIVVDGGMGAMIASDVMGLKTS